MSGCAAPQVSQWMLRWFTAYARRYFRRHMHALLVAQPETLRGIAGPLVIYLNHPSWWDPITCLLLAHELLPERCHYAPMDAAALARYKFFAKLGFYPVAHSISGTRSFLTQSQAVLASAQACLWITAQGKFADARERPLSLLPGIMHLARSGISFTAVPLALEYTFFEERKPEVLASFGAPVASADLTGPTMAQQLEREMQTLATAAIARDLTGFVPLLRARSGVGGAYDIWRRMRAYARGQRFRSEHAAASVPSRQR